MSSTVVPTLPSRRPQTRQAQAKALAHEAAQPNPPAPVTMLLVSHYSNFAVGVWEGKTLQQVEIDQTNMQGNNKYTALALQIQHCLEQNPSRVIVKGQSTCIYKAEALAKGNTVYGSSADGPGLALLAQAIKDALAQGVTFAFRPMEYSRVQQEWRNLREEYGGYGVHDATLRTFSL